MNREESLLETLLGVLLIVSMFILCFTYSGHKAIEKLLSILF